MTALNGHGGASELRRAEDAAATRLFLASSRNVPIRLITAGVIALAALPLMPAWIALAWWCVIAAIGFVETRLAKAVQGGLRLWLLDAPGGPLASFLCLEWDSSVGLYNSGFDPERAALSPGVVLIAHTIRDAIVRGRRRFDFLRGEERYKYDFGPTPEDVFRVTLG